MNDGGKKSIGEHDFGEIDRLKMNNDAINKY